MSIDLLKDVQAIAEDKELPAQQRLQAIRLIFEYGLAKPMAMADTDEMVEVTKKATIETVLNYIKVAAGTDTDVNEKLKKMLEAA